MVGSSVCRFYHLEPLLAFMVAGFIVENFTVMGDRLIRGLERSAFPVYVVFFAISGASIDLSALASTWGVAVALVLARAAAFYSGGWSAGWVVPSLRPFAGPLWGGCAARPGVTRGFAALIERRFEGGSEFKTVVLAVVAINQLVGPIALTWLLDRKGEAGAMDNSSRPDTAGS